LDALVWAITELIPQSSGFGDYMLEQARLGMSELRKTGDLPQPITREWAVGSVEHALQLQGLIGPPR
jgi:hypothetical protein